MDSNDSRSVVGKNVFPSNPPLQIAISTFNLANIAFVVFISLKINKNDMSRLYTLWLYMVHLPSDVVQIVICFLQLGGIVDSSGNYYRDYFDFVQMTGKLLGGIASHVYKILCLLMLIATFMSYTFPFTFQRVFHPKRRTWLYLGGVIFVILQVLFSEIQTIVTVHYGEHISEDVRAGWYLSIHVMGLSTLSLPLLFYALSLAAICRYSKRTNNSQITHRRQLVSVLVYATTPNVLVLIGLIANVFNFMTSGIDEKERTVDHPIVKMGSIANLAYRYVNYARVPIITISTFVAFTPYRRALASILPFRMSKIVHVKSMATTCQTVSTQKFSHSPVWK